MLPAWLYRGPGTDGAHFPCHWPPQCKNRSNVVQELPQRGRLHHISGKFIEIVYATQKACNCRDLSCTRWWVAIFLCLINIHKVADKFMYILDFYALYLFHNSVFLDRTWYRDSTRVVLPEYGKISIPKNWSNVRILTSTATYAVAYYYCPF